MEELVNAVLCSSQGGHALHGEAVNYCNSVKYSPEGWQQCVQYIEQANPVDPQVFFFCLNVILHRVEKGYDSLSANERGVIKQALFNWIGTSLPTADEERLPGFVVAKCAQILVVFFHYEFLSSWGSFFADLAGMCASPRAISLFVHVCEGIYACTLYHEDGSPVQGSAAIKDRMRETCVADLTNMWCEIVQSAAEAAPVLAGRALRLLGLYTTWIEIGLVANATVLGVVYDALNRPAMRTEATACLAAMVAKGMPPAEKIALVDALALENVLPAVGAATEASFALAGANLANTLVSTLLRIPRECADDQTRFMHALNSALPFLASNHAGVTETILPGVDMYLTNRRGGPALRPAEEEFVHHVMQSAVHRLLALSPDPEDDAAGLRKQVFLLFTNATRLNFAAGLAMAHGLLGTTDRAAVVLGLALLSQLLELNVAAGVEELDAVVREAVACCAPTSGADALHAAAYFELVARATRIFVAEPARLQEPMACFLGVFETASSAEIVATTAPLFARFVRKHAGVFAQACTLSDLVAYASSLLQRMAARLEEIEPVYEALALIIHELPAEAAADALHGLLADPMRALAAALAGNAVPSTGAVVRLLTAACKIFSQTRGDHAVAKVLLSVAHEAAAALGDAEAATDEVCTAVYNFMHAMMAPLGAELVSVLRIAMAAGFSDAATPLQAAQALALLTQTLETYPDADLAGEALPLICRVVERLAPAGAYAAVVSDAEREAQDLRRNFLNFVRVLVARNLSGVVVQAGALEFVLQALTQGCADPLNNVVSTRHTVRALNALLQALLGSAEPVLPEVARYVLDQLLPQVGESFPATALAQLTPEFAALEETCRYTALPAAAQGEFVA